MTQKEYKQCISLALCPEYEEMLAQGTGEHTFSPQFEKKMQKLIKRRKKPYYSMVNTALKRAAVIVLAVFITAFTAVMSVDALRKPFISFITSPFRSCSNVKSEPQSSTVYPATIKEKYRITGGIDGFETVYCDETAQRISIDHTNGSKSVMFEQWVVEAFDKNVNTEDCETERVEINGCEAMGWSDNKGYYHLIWNNGEYVFCITSNVGKDELITMAKSVQKAEK